MRHLSRAQTNLLRRDALSPFGFTSFLFLLLFSISQLDAARIDYPKRVLITQKPNVDSHTLVLWSFDRKSAKDDSLFVTDARVAGEVSYIDEGRFGAAIELKGESVLMGKIKRKRVDSHKGMTIEFWVKFNQYPEREACLYEQTMNQLKVYLNSKGQVSLKAHDIAKSTSEIQLKPGEWNHIAVTGYTVYEGNDIYAKDRGLNLMVNAKSELLPLVGRPQYTFPSGLHAFEFSLGNSLKLDMGFKGQLDGFRIFNREKIYYKLLTQDFVDPEATRAIEKRTEDYFRYPERLVFHEDFSSQSRIDQIYKVSEEKVEKVSLSVAREEGELSLSTKSKAKDLVEHAPGVHGKGIVIRRTARTASMELPKAVNLKSGTLEFWLKPEDWDNLTKAAPNYKIPNSPNMVTIYGDKPEDGHKFFFGLRRWRRENVTITPTRWNHFLVCWGEGLPTKFYVNGKHETEIPKERPVRIARDFYDMKVKRIVIGGMLGTQYDEFRVYDYRFMPEEIENAYLQLAGKMKRLEPLDLQWDYRINTGEMNFRLVPLLRFPERVKKVLCTFSLPGGKDVSIKGNEIKTPVSYIGGQVGFLKVGTYPTKIELFDKNERLLASKSGVFERKKLVWWKNRRGMPKKPPTPFTAVEVKKNFLGAIGREYKINSSGLIDQIEVRGEKILAAPMRMQLKSSKGSAEFRSSHSLQFEEHTSIHAKYRAAMKAGGVEIKTRALFEFDGMLKYEMEMSPLEKNVEISELKLVVPLKEKYAKLYHILPKGGDFRNYEAAGVTSAKQGLILDSLSYTKSRFVAKPALGNFIPMVWLGGYLRGLCFFADNDQGWVPVADKPAITVERRGKEVVLSLNIIPTKHVLTEKRKIVFAFVATPQKPLPKHHRAYNRGDYEKYPKIAGRLTSSDSFAPWVTPVKAGHFTHWPKNFDWKWAGEAAKVQRKVHEGKYPKGVALMKYHDKAWCATGPLDLYQRREHYSKVGGRWLASYPQTRIDSLAWHWAQYMDHDVYDGMYIDDTFPIPDYNERSGSAYILPSGKIQPGNPVFGYRQLAKRYYTLMEEKGKVPIITTHMTATLMIPWHSFVTVIFDGEAGARFDNRDMTFMDAWALDRLMALNIAERTGLVTSFMIKADYIDRELNRNAVEHMVFNTSRSYIACQLLFDWNWKLGLKGKELNRAWSEYMEPDTQVFPFWKNGHLLKVSVDKGQSISEKNLPIKSQWKTEMRKRLLKTPCYATIYKKKNRALLVVANFVKKTLKVKVNLDYKKLGLRDQDYEKVHIANVDDWPMPEGIETTFSRKDLKIEDSDIHKDPFGDLDLDDDSKSRGYAKEAIELKVLGQNFTAVEITWHSKDKRHMSMR